MLLALAQATAALPFSDLSVFGDALGGFVGGALRVRRAHVEASMARAGVASPRESAAAMYRSLGTSALELLWIGGSRAAVSDLVRFDASAREALRDADARGAVIAASHTGNWDLAACAVASRSRLLVVTKHLSMRLVDSFWQTTRASRGVALTSAAGALERGRAHVAARGAVAMMIDQVPLRRAHSIRLQFLGEDAWVDRAPATLAARAGAPMIVSAARRDDRGVQEIAALEVIAPPARASRAWIDEATARANAALERFVRAHPSEWLWMHRRWKTPAA